MPNPTPRKRPRCGTTLEAALQFASLSGYRATHSGDILDPFDPPIEHNCLTAGCRRGLYVIVGGLCLLGMMPGCGGEPPEGKGLSQSIVHAKMRESDRWDTGPGWVSPSADINHGTFNEIRNALNARSESRGNDQAGHVDAFEQGSFLAVVSWLGDPRGNVYDIRLRVYDCSPFRSTPDCLTGFGLAQGASTGADVQYAKIIDRGFSAANACTVCCDGFDIWADVRFVGGECCRYRFDAAGNVKREECGTLRVSP